MDTRERVLLVGTTGFLGTYLCPALTQYFQVDLWDPYLTPSRDLRNTTALVESACLADIVVWSGCSVDLRPIPVSWDTWEQNCDALQRFLAALPRNRSPQIIYISTIEVAVFLKNQPTNMLPKSASYYRMGENHDGVPLCTSPLTECIKSHLIDSYTLTKAVAEKIIVESAINLNIKADILRIAHIWGPYDNRFADAPCHRFWPVINYGNTQECIYVQNAANQILNHIINHVNNRNELPNAYAGIVPIYNLTDNLHISLKALASKMYGMKTFEIYVPQILLLIIGYILYIPYLVAKVFVPKNLARKVQFLSFVELFISARDSSFNSNKTGHFSLKGYSQEIASTRSWLRERGDI